MDAARVVLALLGAADALKNPNTTLLGSWPMIHAHDAATTYLSTGIVDEWAKTQHAGISDYVLSNELVSMTLAMVAEDRTVNLIVKHLFEEEGSELYIRNIADYVEPGDDPSFFDVMALARRKDPPEIAVGYRAAGEDHAVLNPPDKHEPRQWHPDDRLVVLAED